MIVFLMWSSVGRWILASSAAVYAVCSFGRGGRGEWTR